MRFFKSIILNAKIRDVYAIKDNPTLMIISNTGLIIKMFLMKKIKKPKIKATNNNLIQLNQGDSMLICLTSQDVDKIKAMM